MDALLSRRVHWTALVVIVCLLALPALSLAGRGGDTRIIQSGHDTHHVSTGPVEMSKSQGDTFVIYGGPGSVVGKFQTLLQSPGGAPDPQGWTGVDRTVGTPIWHVIALDGSGGAHNALLSGNHAVAAHHDDVDYFGYGNNWDERLMLKLDAIALGKNTLTDSTEVRLQFDVSVDLEPGYDYFHADILTSGVGSGSTVGGTTTVGGWTYDPVEEEYISAPVDLSFTYQPADYVGDAWIWLRLRVTSDGAWSDEDGFWPTAGRGAAVVDNIVVSIDGVAHSTASWEDLGGGCGNCGEGDISGHDNGVATGTSGWQPTPSQFVGDFSKLVAGLCDLDPCRDNPTPQWSFIDDGSPPNNDPTPYPPGSIPYDGSTSSSWPCYPYVVNYTGGLTNGTNGLVNHIRSPDIEVDLPGSADDIANGGFTLSYSVYSHLPLTNGIFRVWRAVPYRSDLGWFDWDDNYFVYFENEPQYKRIDVDISSHMVSGVEKIRIQLGAEDLAGLFDFPGTDATASPLYDNVTVKKYRIGGPVLSTRTAQLMSDGFPNDQTLTGSIRWDSVFDRGVSNGPIIPGDSLTVDILAQIPGSTILDPPGGVGGVLRAAIVGNPDFGDLGSGPRATGLAAAGAVPAGHVNDTSDPKFGWEIYEITVPGEQVINNGTPVDDRYFWDLPDGAPNVNAPHQAGVDVAGVAVFFPGDVIHYYVEASDDLGNTTTLPADLSGYLDFTAHTPYSRIWTTRGLPSDTGGIQPKILWWNDAGHGEGEDEWTLAWRQAGFVEGRHFDSYTTKAPTSQEGNGLGSTPHHGAAAAQLSGYECLVYSSGDLSDDLIGDGTGIYKSNDIAVLSAWHNQSGPRSHVYFGDDFAFAMDYSTPAARTYLRDIVGVEHGLGVSDVSVVIEGQTAPLVLPVGGAGCGSFATRYVAYGGCFNINDFDWIVPHDPAVVTLHEFTDRDGDPYPAGISASLYWSRMEGGFAKKTIAFAHDLSFVQNVLNGPDEASVPRAQLLRELMSCLGHDAPGPGVVGSEEIQTKRFVVEANHPNPFNPTTAIQFNAPSRGELTLRIYNVRGQLVHERWKLVESGAGRFEWNGRDGTGTAVASGIYPYEVRGFGQAHRGRMVLLK